MRNGDASFGSRVIGRRDVLRMAAGSVTFLAQSSAAAPTRWLVFWGTYTEPGGQFGEGVSKGIYVSHFDAATGKLTQPELAAESINPLWLLIHPSGRFLYASNEHLETPIPPGEVSAFAIDRRTGKLTEINRVSSRGGQACHVCLDRTSKMLFVANWYSGSLAAFPVRDDGGLGASTGFSKHEGERSGAPAPGQPQNHCHSVLVTPDNRFLLATNTGLNRVYVYRLDIQKANFVPNDPPYLGLQKPTNPRHLALHPNVKWAYVSNEIAPGGCTMLRFDAGRGLLEEGPVAASVPADYNGRASPAECVIHPSGKFVYVTNRGHNSIAVFRIDPGDGTLTSVEVFAPGGDTPRSCAIDPSGTWLISMMQKTGEIAPLRIDQETGKLSDAGGRLKMATPVCATFLEAV